MGWANILGMEKTDMNGNSDKSKKEVIIYAPQMDELDITGQLLEKFTPGTTYDEKTKQWTVPEEIREHLLASS